MKTFTEGIQINPYSLITHGGRKLRMLLPFLFMTAAFGMFIMVAICANSEEVISETSTEATIVNSKGDTVTVKKEFDYIKSNVIAVHKTNGRYYVRFSYSGNEESEHYIQITESTAKRLEKEKKFTFKKQTYPGPEKYYIIFDK